MKNFYLIFMLVCFMGGMVLSAKAEEKEPLIIEMLNKRGKDKMLLNHATNIFSKVLKEKKIKFNLKK